jgi:hypothetical protein
MTDYAATAPVSSGAAISQVSGTASADTVPAGCTLLIFNGDAAPQTVDLAIGYTFDGLSPGSAATPGKRRITVTNATYQVVRVPSSYGDANGRVALAISGATPANVKYWCIGA